MAAAGLKPDTSGAVAGQHRELERSAVIVVLECGEEQGDGRAPMVADVHFQLVG